MNSISVLFLGAICGYLSGNPQAREITFKQIQKLSGMAIDGLNKQGVNNVQSTNAHIKEPPEQQE